MHQLATADTRQKRDDAAEAVTPNILDTIKTGIENTFSEKNIKNAVDNFNEIGDKLKDLGTKVVTNVQNALKADEAAPVPAPAS